MLCKSYFLRLFCLFLCLTFAPVLTANQRVVSMIFASGVGVGPRQIDEKLRSKLEELGLKIQVDFCTDYKKLSLDRLSAFDILVMVNPPLLAQRDVQADFRRLIPVVLDYVRAGGGLILFSDEQYQNYKNLNELLAELNAEIGRASCRERV